MITIDHSMSWIIWPLLMFGLFAIRGGRRRRYGAAWGWWDRGSEAPPPSFDPELLLKEIDAQREQIEELSSRLAELENRADFAERMLATPKDAVSR